MQMHIYLIKIDNNEVNYVVAIMHQISYWQVVFFVKDRLRSDIFLAFTIEGKVTFTSKDEFEYALTRESLCLCAIVLVKTNCVC